MAYRVGQGFDVHAFGEGDDPEARATLTLGGVEVHGAPPLAGHSDGDVVLHALVDALLGAAGMGDIGDLVGIDAPETAGRPSHEFVEAALRRLEARGWSVANADITIVAQRPRLGEQRERMRSRMAGLLGVAESEVNVKATSTDRLGTLGRSEGIACLAVVMLEDAPTN